MQSRGQKILCLGDIQWELENTELVKTADGDYEQQKEAQDILGELKNHIDDVSPSLLLFTGDVINDGWNSEEHVEEFLDVLHYLEQRQIPSYTIKGNHDEYSNYEAVKTEISELTYAAEISEKVTEFDGTTIAGLPYSYTHSLKSVRQIGEEFPGPYDILMAHAERKRRVWLFDVDADIILTGHFATELFEFQDQLFVSMGSYPANSVVIEPEQNMVTYRQSLGDSYDSEQDTYTTTVKRTDDGLEWIEDQYDPGVRLLRDLKTSRYAELVAALRTGKHRIEHASEEDKKAIVEELLQDDVPKTHIQEYIGRFSFL